MMSAGYISLHILERDTKEFVNKLQICMQLFNGIDTGIVDVSNNDDNTSTVVEFIYELNQFIDNFNLYTVSVVCGQIEQVSLYSDELCGYFVSIIEHSFLLKDNNKRILFNIDALVTIICKHTTYYVKIWEYLLNNQSENGLLVYFLNVYLIDKEERIKDLLDILNKYKDKIENGCYIYLLTYLNK